MNPRHSAKADAYILAWKGILHGKRLNSLTIQRKLRQKLLNQADRQAIALMKGIRTYDQA